MSVYGQFRDSRILVLRQHGRPRIMQLRGRLGWIVGIGRLDRRELLLLVDRGPAVRCNLDGAVPGESHVSDYVSARDYYH